MSNERLSPCQDQTKYRALFCRQYHDKGDIKTRKQWNDIYMIDVAQRKSDFVKVDAL